MSLPAARFSNPPRWSRAIANTAFACAASLALHALALGGLAWLYRSSAAHTVASLDVQIASVYLAPAAPPRVEPVLPPAASASSRVDELPATPQDLPIDARAAEPVSQNLAQDPMPVDRPARIPAARTLPRSDAPSSAAFSSPASPSDTSSSAAASSVASSLDAPSSAVRPATAIASNAAVAEPNPPPASAMAIEWRVQDWLAQHRHYPRAARRSGAEGTVWVRFVLDRAGSLQGSEVLESSGHAVLDRAALDLLQRAAPFPALPADLAMDEIELVLPIEYDLTRAARG